MRQSLVKKSRIERGQVARVQKQLAPTKGWVADRNIIRLDPDAAYQLDNWFPSPFSIKLRPGYDIHNYLQNGTAIDTLMVYEAGNTVNVFAVSGSVIYDVSATDIPISVLPMISAKDIVLRQGDTPTKDVTLRDPTML